MSELLEDYKRNMELLGEGAASALLKRAGQKAKAITHVAKNKMARGATHGKSVARTKAKAATHVAKNKMAQAASSAKNIPAGAAHGKSLAKHKLAQYGAKGKQAMVKVKSQVNKKVASPIMKQKAAQKAAYGKAQMQKSATKFQKSMKALA